MNRRLLWALLLCAALAFTSCGKKSAPRLVVPIKPGPPANLTAIRRTGEVMLFWDKRGSAASFEIYRMAADGSVKTGLTNATRYTDSTPEDAGGFVYTVLAISGEGVNSELSAPLEVGPLPPMYAPDPFNAEITNEGVRLQWGYGGPASFNLYRELINSPFDTDPYAEGIANTVYDDRPNPAETVKYEVRAASYGAANTVRYEGPSSSDIFIAPSAYRPSVAKDLKALRKDGEVVLLWDENPEQWITGYEILREGKGWAEDFEVIGSSWPPAFTDHTPPPGETAYRVRAIGPGGAGPLSDIARAEAAPPPDATPPAPAK